MTVQNPVEFRPAKNTTHREDLDEHPFNRIWRGNKEGTVTVAGVPKFTDKYEEREWIKGHMAAAFRYWGKLGFGEGTAGHITCRDPVLPDHYWMNPFGVHFSLITKSNLVLVGPDGYVTKHGAQLGINYAGYVIHTAIHKARPDVVAAAHCHSIYGKTWSVFGKPIEILQQDGCLFHDNLSVYANFGGVVLGPEEGENIAKALGPKNKTAILQNHGLLTLGNTIDECVYLFALLDRHCHLQLLAEAAAANGIPKSIISPKDAEYTVKTTGYWEALYLNFQPEYELLVKETNGDFLQ
ncbi:arad-like aldolase/epimerase [Mycena rebaudengoi]|nr:arad-like aldolase/epimerase [Mycena rebaudengoi]